ncbi:ACT-like domain protein [Raphanus sativus]|nr:ACT-like domain protein [Raphanus sativus]
MESSQLRTRNLTTSDLMGGRSSVEEDILCQFTFPERPGALMNFLDSFGPRPLPELPSLFHYREGGAGADVLVEIQVPEQEMVTLISRFTSWLGLISAPRHSEDQHFKALSKAIPDEELVFLKAQFMLLDPKDGGLSLNSFTTVGVSFLI